MATNGPHSAGIFADMTVDGPEIGTLVLVVDRAKNLPNRKTMGKQNPYCAARLGKEARKTETDRRGGQTPKWDQELRFTVHDSPDYYNLKISCFSEDKRTDLIGEAWVGLNDVIVPGGGKADLWQSLNCKGKYAGDLRIELTYYDSREKPVKGEEIVSVADELKQQYGGLQPKVKRRPLPSNPNAPVTTPVVIPERPQPGRAKHGPRDLQMHARTSSMPPQTFNYPHSAATLTGHGPLHQDSPVSAHDQSQQFGEYDANPDPEVYDPYANQAMQQPDFLPQLAPSSRQRGLPAQPRFAQRQQSHPIPQPQPPHQHPQSLRPASHIGLPHSHSAPAAPTLHAENHEYENAGFPPQSNWPQQIPDVEYQYQHLRQQRRNDVPPGWEQEYGSAHPGVQPYVENDIASSPPPPPPPMHSNSSPAVPNYASTHAHPYQTPTARYGATPPSVRQQHMHGSSPVQSIERGYTPPRTAPLRAPPARAGSMDEYGNSPYVRSYESTPNLTPQHQASSPIGQGLAGRRSFVDSSTPTRPHPLSQQVPRARSPMPYHRGASEPPQEYHGREQNPPVKPRASSPQPPAARSSAASKPTKSSFSIQFPVRAFESADGSPLSTSQASPTRVLPTRMAPTPVRKSVSPRPSFSESPAIPFSPDSFDVHRPTSDLGQASNGPIVGWHGQEIDPSDHLPVEAWAPEPTPKGTSNVGPKTYGLGRDRDFGPRTAIPSTGGRVGKDTVINVRLKAASQPPPEPAQQGRNRLQKKNSPGPAQSPGGQDFRSHEGFSPVPNPYERSYGSPSQPQYQQQHPFSRSLGGGRESSAPPSVPPKVPLGSSYGQQPVDDYYGTDALTREISSIDLGARRRERLGSAPPPETGAGMGRDPTREARFVPVRSHRERGSLW
ncbi:unnamed protein product [Zymoseptoria tritici ST99CH_1A5]|uniref:C2 domain-containing protein n=1 Tax=Zymoseptoria tritici ST99CH_1A5 TaxID=1276529 RepID=A0A1Y6L326_ZYMTR|nr:unnamed protein product [Zymoseptoria tritici ST99CH_3D1]SMY18863.1 unnamed protein product [Zymoseptoria tritici ST99CH_1A5]